MEIKKNFPEKQEFRSRHKMLRAQMPQQEAAEKSRKICERLKAASWYQDCSCILGYVPLPHEVDCRDFLEQAKKDGKKIALPRTAAGCAMDFFLVEAFDELVEGNFHVREPKEKCPLFEPKENREQMVVLVPGVVFDRMGNRYGYGKGYYDRYFLRFPMLCRYALAFENQIEEALTVEITDQKMQRIYTEEAEYCFRDEETDKG